MNVGYAYELPADDINTRSGHPYSILRQLEKRARVERLFPLNRAWKYAFVPKYLHHKSAGRVYRPNREPLLLRSYASQIKRRLRNGNADCIFAPSSIVISDLDIDLPKIFCADATFANVVEFYEEYSRCAPEYMRLAHEQERRALANCTAAIYPSEWAARSAIEDYHADSRKVHVVPFGANVKAPPRDVVARSIEGSKFEPFRILFIGRDWKRKGGDIVLRTCEMVQRDRIPLRLDLVGLDDVPEPLPTYAVNHGVLEKNNDEKNDRLQELLMQAHLLFVPSRAENYGMAFCEAAAYGVPSLSTDIGGIPTVVRTGETGFSLPADSPPEAYAQAIHECISHPKRYAELAWSARRFYDSALNWDAFGEKLIAILSGI